MPETTISITSLLFLGFWLGMRHATDADHVIAIATIVARYRALRGAALIGAAWGVGHTLTIMVIGGLIILLGLTIPPRIGLAMEFGVGIMLVALGILSLTGIGVRLHAPPRHAMMEQPPVHSDDHVHLDHAHAHAHGDYVHSHPHGHGDAPHGHRDDLTPIARLDRSRLGPTTVYALLRPFIVGIVHGLAGSAAVALLVLTAVHDPLWAMTYLLLFGAGTVAGMMLITVALSAPFALTASKLPRFNWNLRVAAGLVSFGFGLIMIYEIGFAQGGLFTDAPHWNPG